MTDDVHKCYQDIKHIACCLYVEWVWIADVILQYEKWEHTCCMACDLTLCLQKMWAPRLNMTELNHLFILINQGVPLEALIEVYCYAVFIFLT